MHVLFAPVQIHNEGNCESHYFEFLAIVIEKILEESKFENKYYRIPALVRWIVEEFILDQYDVKNIIDHKIILSFFLLLP